LSDAIGSAYAETPAIHVETTVTDGMELLASAYAPSTSNVSYFQNVSTNVKTKNVWLSLIPVYNVINASAAQEVLGVFYKDTSDSKVKLFGALVLHYNSANAEILRVNNGNTKDTNIVLDYVAGDTNSTTVNLNLDIVADSTSDLNDNVDDLNMSWGISATEFNRLGVTADTEETNELQGAQGTQA